MVKRASTFGRTKVFAVALVACLFSLALAHSSLARLRFSDEEAGSPQEMGLTATGRGAGQLMALSADKTHLINTFTNKPVFITGEAAWSLIAATF